MISTLHCSGPPRRRLGASLREAAQVGTIPAHLPSRHSRRPAHARGYGTDAVDAARVALDDLAHGRITGKALGQRHVSGNLTGLASAKFDVPDSPTRRFRVVYAEIDASTRGVLAIGVREGHAIYRLAVQRFHADEQEGRPSQ